MVSFAKSSGADLQKNVKKAQSIGTKVTKSTSTRSKSGGSELVKTVK